MRPLQLPRQRTDANITDRREPSLVGSDPETRTNMPRSEIQVVRPGRGPTAPAIVFVHGFSGDPRTTWGQFPKLLAKRADLADWGIVRVGYSTSIAPSLRGVWSADPPLDTLAEQLITQCTEHEGLADRRALVIVAHSMGGLVAQRALLDALAIADRRRGGADGASSIERTCGLALLGVPSAGLRKAWFVRWWKAQLKDMARGSTFVTKLRRDWRERFGDAPDFPFVAVAGERDEFVGRESSIEPFPARLRRVVPGDHVQMVKPGLTGDLAVEIVGGLCFPRRANSSTHAVERANHQLTARLAKSLHSADSELSDAQLKKYMKSLSQLGRDDEAIELARKSPPRGADAKGMVAGLHKRRWLAAGREEDARSAYQLYRACYGLASADKDAAQAWYHGINVAFLELFWKEKADAAHQTAADVLVWCNAVDPKTLTEPDRMWRLATIGEAQLQLGEVKAAFAAYRAAFDLDPEIWQIDSMALHAVRVGRVRLSKPECEQLIGFFAPRCSSELGGDR